MNATATRYAKIVTLAARGATEGERAAARAAQVRCLNAHPELVDGHPLRSIDGFRWEILDGLRACWSHTSDRHGWTCNTVELGWLLAGFDFKELRGALHTLRAEFAAGWQRGVYTGTGDLKFCACAEWLLQQALRKAAEAEGCTAEEVARLVA